MTSGSRIARLTSEIPSAVPNPMDDTIIPVRIRRRRFSSATRETFRLRQYVLRDDRQFIGLRASRIFAAIALPISSRAEAADAVMLSAA